MCPHKGPTGRMADHHLVFCGYQPCRTHRAPPGDVHAAHRIVGDRDDARLNLSCAMPKAPEIERRGIVSARRQEP